jgi:molybdate transport system ATP-binding protein
MTGLQGRIVLVRNGFRLEVDLEVGPGRILAVLGPNGSGKTTLLRALAGLLPLTEGRLAVAGQTWDDTATGRFVPASQRAVGLVFQDYRLFPHLSVLDNVAFGPRARGAGRAGARDKATAVLEQLDVASLAARRPAALSGGQAQRVALARALASEPRLLLLDEPTAALDAGSRLEVRGRLRHYLSGFTGPTVLVTHDPLEAMVLADSILVLEGGRVVQQGPPAAVARQPATEYVARLVGLNLYPGALTDPASRRVALDAGGHLYAAGPPGTEPGARMLVAVSPTAISLHVREPDPGSARNIWTGHVAGLELLTDRVRVAVTGEPDALVDVTAAAVAELGLWVDRRVWMTAKATEVLAYPDQRSPFPDAPNG